MMKDVEYRITLKDVGPPGYEYGYYIEWREFRLGWRKYKWTGWRRVKYYTYAGGSDHSFKDREAAQKWIDGAVERKRFLERERGR